MRYFFLRYAIRDIARLPSVPRFDYMPALGSATFSARLKEFVVNRHLRHGESPRNEKQTHVFEKPRETLPPP
ncbi:hypothetical protein L596_017143 [Steinernema carpocapsae]|uniref:Uncharacterized protein n=1 Tax=Steinernema carpocapsae TaxID=34508 RepID=A0A4U5N1J2_STECR|nr:hypothetical protein L596_017143 [Steinernema carpocapsae]